MNEIKKIVKGFEQINNKKPENLILSFDYFSSLDEEDLLELLDFCSSLNNHLSLKIDAEQLVNFKLI